MFEINFANNIFVSLASILVLGISAQWLSWRFHLPSILILLIFGLTAGHIGLIDSDALMGQLLVPFVSFSVALILFEGSLTLQIQELRETGRVVWNLNTLGVLITWILCAIAGLLIFGLSPSIALLLGAILSVTGPTVVLPLLLYVRPAGQVSHILKWEGILIDSIGAMLAIFVFEAILATEIGSAFYGILFGILKVVLIASILGTAGAWFIALLLRQHWVPDYLGNPVTLTTVFAVFVAANLVYADSGLLTVTVMGVVLANQKVANIKHIVEFKETLRVLLLSSLFIILSARVPLEHIFTLGLSSIVFLAILILVIRPISVYFSTRHSTLNRQEKLFLAGMAPRGIVAGSIASIFALRLAEEGFEQAELIVPIVFTVILGTVILYSIIAKPLVKVLNLQGNPQGALILGAQRWARDIGKILQSEGLPVLMLDTNYSNIAAARWAGLEAYHGNILSDYALEELDLTGLGHLYAMTPNNQVNSLAALRFMDIFGAKEVYQLPPSPKIQGREDTKDVSQELCGRLMFDSKLSYQFLDNLYHQGASIQIHTIPKESSFEEYLRQQGEAIIPLFVISETGKLLVYTADNPPPVKPEQKVISLVLAKDPV